jgi:hypothetical protein
LLFINQEIAKGDFLLYKTAIERLKGVKPFYKENIERMIGLFSQHSVYKIHSTGFSISHSFPDIGV